MRIVSLVPSRTDIIAGLGLGAQLVGAQLVGVSHECDHPNAASARSPARWLTAAILRDAPVDPADARLVR